MRDNFVIEALTQKHGEDIIQAMKLAGINPNGYGGTMSRENGDGHRFYGMIDGDFENYTIETVRLYPNVKILTLEQFEAITFHGKSLKEVAQPIKNIAMQITKTQPLKINGVKRIVTIAVVVGFDCKVNTGYSVCLPEDVFKEKLSIDIAVGRALKPKTNLTPDMEVGKGMDKKYILYAIAEDALKRIEKGTLVIKGIRPTPKKK